MYIQQLGIKKPLEIFVAVKHRHAHMFCFSYIGVYPTINELTVSIIIRFFCFCIMYWHYAQN